MAKDVVQVLDHLGWTEQRELNVVGCSLGGMVAQELALQIPDRISSLTLISTASRMVNTIGIVPFIGNRVLAVLPLSMSYKLAWVKKMLFSPGYLDRPDDTPYDVEPFPTNGDRFAAIEMQKRLNPNCWNRWGVLSQAWAAMWHNKTPAQLSHLGDLIERERICIVHGTEDKVMTFPHAETLLEGLGGEERGVSTCFFKGQGHVIPLECRKELHEVISNMVQKGRKLNDLS